jgi:hypothetical protein
MRGAEKCKFYKSGRIVTNVAGVGDAGKRKPRSIFVAGVGDAGLCRKTQAEVNLL